MKRVYVPGVAVSVLLMPLMVSNAGAGAKVQINEDAEIDLGFRLQTLYLNTDRDLDADGSFEKVGDFLVRRARLRLDADVNQNVSIFLQTEFSQEGASGGNVRLIDAFVKFKLNKLATIIIGENMAPVTRQNLTSSGGLLVFVLNTGNHPNFFRYSSRSSRSSSDMSHLGIVLPIRSPEGSMPSRMAFLISSSV